MAEDKIAKKLFCLNGIFYLRRLWIFYDSFKNFRPFFIKSFKTEENFRPFSKIFFRKFCGTKFEDILYPFGKIFFAVLNYIKDFFPESKKILFTILIIYIGSSVLTFLQHYIMAGVVQNLITQLRARLNKKLTRLPLSGEAGSAEGRD